MAAPPQQIYQFHDSIKSKLTEWRRNPNKGTVYLVYGLSPFPWAEMRSEYDVVAIPLPTKPYPYGSWRDWMQDYLEDQFALVGEELNENVFVMDSRGKLVPPTRKRTLEEVL